MCSYLARRDHIKLIVQHVDARSVLYVLFIEAAGSKIV
jgi:hypothetical protein